MLRLLFALDRALLSAVLSRVPITWPAVTVAPREVCVVAIVPVTPNAAVTSLSGAMLPLAVMLLVTAPCFTVEVSWVADAVFVAANGLATSR